MAGAIGITLIFFGIVVEALGITPQIKAFLKIPIPITLSGPLGGVMIFVGVIFYALGL